MERSEAFANQFVQVFSILLDIRENPWIPGVSRMEVGDSLCFWFASRLSENSQYRSAGPLCLFGSFSSQALPSLGQAASASTWSVVASLDQTSFWLPVSLWYLTVPSIFSKCLWVFSNYMIGLPCSICNMFYNLTMKFTIKLMWEKHAHHAPAHVVLLYAPSPTVMNRGLSLLQCA